MPVFPNPLIPQRDEPPIIPNGADGFDVQLPPPPNGGIGPQGGVVDPRTGMPAPPLPGGPPGLDIEGAEDVIDQEFNQNLADALDDQDRYTIANDIIEWVDIDKESMKDWATKLADGLEVLGVTDVPAAKAAFKGAATVTYPLLAEAVVQFQARAIDEMFPPAGPVKAISVGNTGPSETLIQQAQDAQKQADEAQKALQPPAPPPGLPPPNPGMPPAGAPTSPAGAPSAPPLPQPGMPGPAPMGPPPPQAGPPPPPGMGMPPGMPMMPPPGPDPMALQQAQMTAQLADSLQQQIKTEMDKAQAVEEKRQRNEDYMNYHLTDEDEEYFDECDMMLFYLPLAGTAFKKVYYDETLGFPVSRFVKGEDMIVPYTATTLRNAPRYTHVYHMTHNDLLKQQYEGIFSEIEVPEPSSEDPQAGNLDNELIEAKDTAEGRQPQYDDKDYRHTIYECHCDYDLPGFEDEYGIKLPYVVTIDVESRQVLRVVRNWKRSDVKRRKRIWFVPYRYLPGLGFYGFGLLHFIGSLCIATSATVNTLLNSGALSSLQGGFKTKEGAPLKDGTLTVEPGVFKDVDISYDDLNKAFWVPPFKEPSKALVDMLQLLIETGRRFASITEAMTGEGDAKNAPVGSIVALIEQAGKVFSAIHKRSHKSARQEFKLLAELMFEHLPVEGYPYSVAGDRRMVFADDFDEEVDVLPVSDPNIFSATQRVAIAQAVIQVAAQAPDKVDVEKAIGRLFEAMRVPNWQELVIPPSQQQGPPPDPAMLKAQAEIEAKKAETAMKAQQNDQELQHKKDMATLEMQLKQREMEMKLKLAQEQHQIDLQMAQMKAQQAQEQATLQHHTKLQMLREQGAAQAQQAQQEMAQQEQLGQQELSQNQQMAEQDLANKQALAKQQQAAAAQRPEGQR